MTTLHIFVLLLGAVQWVRAKPLNATTTTSAIATATNSNATLTPEQQLVQFYDDKLNSLYPEINANIEQLIKKILKEESVEMAATSFLRVFKRRMEDLLIVNSFNKRFHSNKTLAEDFSDEIKNYYQPKNEVNKDIQYVTQLVGRLGYDELRKKYKTELMKFVSEEFLPKYEGLTSRHPNKGVHTKELETWMTALKDCDEYECYLNNFATSSQSSFQKHFSKVFKYIYDKYIVHEYNLTTFAKSVLQDPKLLQLSPLVGQQLSQNLQDLIKLNDNLTEPSEVYVLIVINFFVMFKFDNYANVSRRDRQLITQIFDDHGYTQFEINRGIRKDGPLKERDYLKEFECMISILSRDDLQIIFDALDGLRRANTREEKEKALKVLENIHIDQLNQIIEKAYGHMFQN